LGLPGDQMAVDGIAQGLDGLDVALVRAGRVVKTIRVPIEAGRFTFVIGPVEDGDQVVMSGPGYREVLARTFPGRVTGAPPSRIGQRV
jgi:hypothetical protein